jgi:hypothetical protein
MRSRRGIRITFALAVSLAVVAATAPAAITARSSDGIAPVESRSVAAERGIPRDAVAGPAVDRTERTVTGLPSSRGSSRAVDRGAVSVEGQGGDGGVAAPALVSSFAGINRPQSGVGVTTPTGPPDTIVGSNGTSVIEAVNRAVRLSTSTGTALQTSHLNTFFGASLANGSLFDPKVYYDRNATNQRYYIVALQQSGRGDTSTANDISRLWLAISRSSNPANLNAASWCRYNIDARRNAGTSNASWADYPGLGAGRDALLVSLNNFRFTNDSFTYAIVRAFNKTIASNNAASCPSVPMFTFQPSSTIGDLTNTFTLQPVQHYTSPSSFSGTTNPAYLISTIRGQSALYRIWRIRNVAGGAPTMHATNVSGNFTYNFPPAAPGGSGAPIDTGDVRVLQSAGNGNLLTAAHTTNCQFAGGGVEACVRLMRFSVSQSLLGVMTASISQQVTFGGGDDRFYFYPSVAVNTANATGMAFNRSAVGGTLGVWWGSKTSAAAVPTVGSLANGTCALATEFDSTRGRYRAGDYSGAQLNPADLTTFWVAGERAASFSGVCQWDTRVGRISA